MKFNKKKFLIFVICTIVSLFVSLLIISYNKEISIFFCFETFILMDFFLNIIFNVKDRFNPFSFFLLSTFFGFLDIIFVVCDIRNVSIKYSIEIYEKSLLLLIVWILVFLIAYIVKFKKNRLLIFHEVKIIDNFINSVNINALLIISIIIQFFFTYKVLNTVIHIGGIFKAMNDFSVFTYNNQAYLATLFPLLTITSISLYEKKYKKLSILSLIINFILISLTGRRGVAISTVIISFLVYYNYRQKRISNKFILILIVPILTFVIFIGNIRNQQINVDSSNLIVRTATYITNTIQYGQNIPDMVYKLDNKLIEFQKNKYIFNGFLGMIPRFLWHDKPETDYSHITSKVVYYSDIKYGKPVGVFGFAYFCYGMLGVILSGVICGYLTCSLYKWMLNSKNVLPIIIYSVLVQSFISITNPDSQTKIITMFVIFIFISILGSIKGKSFKNKELK